MRKQTGIDRKSCLWYNRISLVTTEVNKEMGLLKVAKEILMPPHHTVHFDSEEIEYALSAVNIIRTTKDSKQHKMACNYLQSLLAEGLKRTTSRVEDQAFKARREMDRETR